MALPFPPAPVALCLGLVLLTSPAAATPLAPVGPSAATAPRTAVPAQLRKALNEALAFDTFQLSRVRALRAQLQPLAAAGDAVAQFDYARTFDLGPYGLGSTADAQTAYTWYLRAANQNLAEAEWLLYEVHAFGLMGRARDGQAAAQWLTRAYRHSEGALHAAVSMALAGWTSPATEKNRSPVQAWIRTDAARSLAYVEEAYRFSPHDESIINALFALRADFGQYRAAMALADVLQHPSLLLRAARIVQQGRSGVPADAQRALDLLKRAAERELQTDMLGATPALMDLYSALCRKSLTRESLGSLFQADRWQHFQQFAVNCRYVPGG